jgi:probable F420-dependent oxidoreductase
MKIGISRPPTPQHPAIDLDAAIIGRQAERLGFDLVLYGEHPIRPLDQPGMGVHRDGVPFFQDTLVALARISAVTTSLRFGGGVFLAPEHNPVQWAKELASLDWYGDGRLVVGIGVGWSRTECELLGGNFDRRWAQTEEIVGIMRALWSGQPVSHEGEFFSIPLVQCVPTPMSPRGPAILLGGGSDLTLRRAARFGDGWLPAFVTRDAIESGPVTVADGRRRLSALADERGRDPGSSRSSPSCAGTPIAYWSSGTKKRRPMSSACPCRRSRPSRMRSTRWSGSRRPCCEPVLARVVQAGSPSCRAQGTERG